MFCSIGMVGLSIVHGANMGMDASYFEKSCVTNSNSTAFPAVSCSDGVMGFISKEYGGFGGFNTSAQIADLKKDSLTSEAASFWISNGPQLLYSLLYLLLIYNVTLISVERDWSKLEKGRQKLRCTIVEGLL